MSMRFVVNDNGKKLGVILPIKQYEKMMKALEDAADERAYDKAMKRNEKGIPARKVFKQIKKKHKKERASKKK